MTGIQVGNELRNCEGRKVGKMGGGIQGCVVGCLGCLWRERWDLWLRLKCKKKQRAKSSHIGTSRTHRYS